MLVLSRKAGESIHIGDSVKLVVNRISANRVTIGIEAPDGVRILRGELDPISNALKEELSLELEEPISTTAI